METYLPELPLEPPEAMGPICPVCGREAYTIYKAVDSEDVVGCDNCIFTKDAWDEPQCFTSE